MEGYYFDENGYNEIGGCYDNETGVYVPPYQGDDIDQYADYYDELIGSDDSANEDSDEEGQEHDVDDYEQIVDESEAQKGIRREHCLPAIKWLQEQQKDKTQMIKIVNLPRRATEDMIRKFLHKKIKNLKIDKLALDTDKKSKQNNGIAWITSNDLLSLIQLLKLHYTVSIYLFLHFIHDFRTLQVYASYKLRTYVMGYAYDTMEEEYNPEIFQEDTNFQKKMMKLSLQQIKQSNVKVKKQDEEAKK